jgi:hypothetical protein
MKGANGNAQPHSNLVATVGHATRQAGERRGKPRRWVMPSTPRPLDPRMPVPIVSCASTRARDWDRFHPKDGALEGERGIGLHPESGVCRINYILSNRPDAAIDMMRQAFSQLMHAARDYRKSPQPEPLRNIPEIRERRVGMMLCGCRMRPELIAARHAESLSASGGNRSSSRPSRVTSARRL